MRAERADGGLTMGYRVGVDVGGTFTDLICVTPTGEIVLDKTPSTLDDQSRGVMNGLGQLAERFGSRSPTSARELDILVHGTTTADNTMIEMNGAAPGCSSPRATATRSSSAAVTRKQIWDPNYPGPTRSPGAGPASRSASAWSTRARWCCRSTKRPFGAACSGCKQLGVRSIAVMYLFSFVNPEHERRTREIVLEEFPDVEHISLSHEVMPRGPEFERVSTTLVNAYVAPGIAHYTGHLQDELRRAPATAVRC